VQRLLDVPAGTSQHHADDRVEAAEPSVDHRLRRLRRMKIDRKLEPLGSRQDRPEEAVVEVASAMMALMSTPLNPCSPTTRSSSAIAADGSAIGSAARPKNRVG
jgi:hypothetical protein